MLVQALTPWRFSAHSAKFVSAGPLLTQPFLQTLLPFHSQAVLSLLLS